MLIGIDSYSFHLAFGKHPDFSPKQPINIIQFMEKVVQLGFDGIQFDPMHLEYNEDTDNIVNFARQNNLFLEYGIIGVKSDDVFKGIEKCRQLNSPVLRSFIGFDRFDKTVSISENLKTAEYEITKITHLLESSNIKLAIENHGDVTSDELVDLVESVDHPNVGICLDIGNSICVFEDAFRAVKRMLPYTFTTHIKDYNIEMTNYGCKISGTSLGKGNLPLHEILDYILNNSSLEKLVLEIPIEASGDEPDTLSKEENAVKDSLNYIHEFMKNYK